MQTVLISGGSSGLGRALAKAFCEESKVISFARRDVQDTFTHPNLTHLSGIDVSDSDYISQLGPTLDQADVLINNVGVAYDGLLAIQSNESIDEVISVNLTSVLQLTRVFLRAKLRQKRPGCIVNVSSIIGIRGYSGLAAYSASKAGLDGMTRAIAREMGPKGFRINSVLPGYFDSAMSSKLMDAQRSQIVRRTPLGRLPTVDDIVPVVKFLASDDSRMITGQSFVVDGGITI